MKILVIGSGGREHAICFKINDSSLVDDIFCVPGNAGIAKIATCLEFDFMDFKKVVDVCHDNEIDFVIIGPELPLVSGIVDYLDNEGIKAFGSSKEASILEASKIYAKDFCTKYKIPTASYTTFDNIDETIYYLMDCEGLVVVKADGLASGKGVILAESAIEACEFVRNIETQFGITKFVIEERLEGEELSYFILSDGKNVVQLGSAQDHKRLLNGDKGPNTGGMGAYSPAPILTDDLDNEIMETIVNPTIKGMIEEGMPYKGILFCGLMITKDGPKLIEYNVRFGDPETQVILPRLDSDLMSLFILSVDGNLDNAVVKWNNNSAITLVMVSTGYPKKYNVGQPITGIDRANEVPSIFVYHAGTKKEKSLTVTAGGRVLNVTSVDNTLKEARDKVYRAAEYISWADYSYRTDIAWRAL